MVGLLRRPYRGGLDPQSHLTGQELTQLLVHIRLEESSGGDGHRGLVMQHIFQLRLGRNRHLLALDNDVPVVFDAGPGGRRRHGRGAVDERHGERIALDNQQVLDIEGHLVIGVQKPSRINPSL